MTERLRQLVNICEVIDLDLTADNRHEIADVLREYIAILQLNYRKKEYYDVLKRIEQLEADLAASRQGERRLIDTVARLMNSHS